jgi:hypothetical protein
MFLPAIFLTGFVSDRVFYLVLCNFLPVVNWSLDEGSYGAAEYLAVDEVLTRNGEQAFRIDALDTPAYLASRRAPYEEVSSVSGNVSRRLTCNASIYIGENTVPYSIIVPCDAGELAPAVFEDEIAPDLLDAFGEFESDLGVDNVNTAIYQGSESRNISGNCLYGTRDAVLCQGLVVIDEWDDGLERMSIDEEEAEEVRDLPKLDASRREVRDSLKRAFVDRFEPLSLNGYQEQVDRLVEDRYADTEWIEAEGSEEHEGFCLTN